MQLMPSMWLGDGNDQAVDVAWIQQHNVTHIIHCGQSSDRPRGRPVLRLEQQVEVEMMAKARKTWADDLEDIFEFVEEQDEGAVFLLAGPPIATLLVAAMLLTRCFDVPPATAQALLLGAHGARCRITGNSASVAPCLDAVYAAATKKSLRK